MNSLIKKIIKIFLIGLVSILYLFSIYLLFSSITDYKPQKIENIELKGNIVNYQVDYDELSLLSWNIGYAGLSKEMDFFYDGGSKVKPNFEIYQKALNGILNTLVKNSYVDFILLQEVDVFSNRSYYCNQKAFISEFLPNFAYAFAVNYDVKYVLLPLYAPMGRVKAGLQTLAKYKPIEIKRHAFAANFDWPKKLLMLDRCFLVTNYLLNNGKQLIVVNTHNSTYDGGLLSKREMDELKLYVTTEYNKGNYVIVGGDWNNNPPGFKKVQSFKNNKIFHLDNEVSNNFMPQNWQWIFDAEIPTNRNVNEAYNAKSTGTTVIDYYLVSPNIEALSIRNLDLDFEFSDHNPVLINVKLK